jgi:hypothetical protein
MKTLARRKTVVHERSEIAAKRVRLPRAAEAISG